MEATLTIAPNLTTPRSMGRPPLGMKEIKVQFPAEMLEKIDALVGDKHRSKFIRDAVAGALVTAQQVKVAKSDPDK